MAIQASYFRNSQNIHVFCLIEVEDLEHIAKKGGYKLIKKSSLYRV
jgi:hypothetical protein